MMGEVGPGEASVGSSAAALAAAAVAQVIARVVLAECACGGGGGRAYWFSGQSGYDILAVDLGEWVGIIKLELSNCIEGVNNIN